VNSAQVASTSEQLMASADQTCRAAEQIAASVQEVSEGADKQLPTAGDNRMPLMSFAIFQGAEETEDEI
jgi:methyl-accepting chemotaxis protein